MQVSFWQLVYLGTICALFGGCIAVEIFRTKRD